MAIQSHSCVTPAASSRPVYLEDSGAVANASSPATATAAWRLNSTGDAERQLNLGSWSSVFEWLKIGSAGDFEARMTMQSGTNFAGSSLATWLALSAARAWSLERSTNGETTGSALLEVRSAISGLLVASATITLTATREA